MDVDSIRSVMVTRSIRPPPLSADVSSLRSVTVTQSAGPLSPRQAMRARQESNFRSDQYLMAFGANSRGPILPNVACVKMFQNNINIICDDRIETGGRIAAKCTAIIYSSSSGK